MEVQPPSVCAKTLALSQSWRAAQAPGRHTPGYCGLQWCFGQLGHATPNGIETIAPRDLPEMGSTLSDSQNSEPVLIQQCRIGVPHLKTSCMGEISYLEERIYLVSFRRDVVTEFLCAGTGNIQSSWFDLESRNKSNQTNCLTVP